MERQDHGITGFPEQVGIPVVLTAKGLRGEQINHHGKQHVGAHREANRQQTVGQQGLRGCA